MAIGVLLEGKMVFWRLLRLGMGSEEEVDLGADEVGLVGEVVAGELGLELLDDVV